MILHNDSTIGRYLHFKHKGVAVKLGQKVKRNTIIGYSGSTGYSSNPHLHFAVTSPIDGSNSKSLEFYFSDKEGNAFTTKPGERYIVDK